MKQIVLGAWCAVMLAMAGSISTVHAADRLPQGVPRGAAGARVWGYIDGNGFKARIDHETVEVLLLGIDVPERNNEAGKADCYGEEAQAQLRTLVPKLSTVYLEPAQGNESKEGALHRYVWVPGADGAKAFLLNKKLLRAGAATLAVDPNPGRFARNLETAEQQARNANRGLWAACRPPNGTWSGGTAEGFPLSFVIRDRGLVEVSIAYSCATDAGFTTYSSRVSWPRPHPIDRHGFTISASGTTFSGMFTSETEAQGTIEFPGGRCSSHVTTTWSATRF